MLFVSRAVLGPLRTALRASLKRYEAVYDKAPYLVAASIIGSKAYVSDIAAQKYASPDQPLDLWRASKFTGFCALYVGSFQHFVYNVLFARLFPGTGAATALGKALTDNFVHSPFIYLPTYYTYRSVVSGGTAIDGLSKYRHEGMDVMQACWGVWVPAQFVNFLLVPPQYRIMYIGVVGLFGRSF